MKQNTLILVVVVVLLCCCLLVAGGGAIYFLFRTSTGAASTLEPLMINASDLPKGWESAQYTYTLPYREGTLAARNNVFDYFYPGDNLARAYLSHEIFLYPSELAGAAGYQKLHDEWINGVLAPINVQSTFKPRNPADKFDIFYTDGNQPNTYYCLFVQGHGRYVILMSSIYDDKVLTAAQLDEILQRLDARLP